MSINSVALTGLKNTTNALTGVANNIANSETTGFKRQSSAFVDLVGGSRFGAGTAIADVKTDFSQGGRETTGRVLDLMVDGNGYFMVSSSTSQQQMYTRDGQFNLDSDGFLVNMQGLRVQGFEQNAAGQYTLNPEDIQIPTSFTDPMPTANITTNINLKAGGAVFSTSVDVYDSLGAENNADVTFTPTGVNAWDVEYTIDGTTYGPNAITFTSTGQIVGAPVHTITVPGFANGAAAQTINVDLSMMTQFDGSNRITALESDGYATGSLEGIEVTTGGIISARYSNGQTLQTFRVGMVTFPNVNGLQNLGQGNYVANVEAGARALGFASENGIGSVLSNSLETSNVDMTEELTELIQLQKAYRANAKVITADKQLTDTTIQMA